VCVVQQETVKQLVDWLADWRTAWQAALDHTQDEVTKGQALLDAAANELDERQARHAHAHRMLRSIDNASWLLTQHPLSKQEELPP